MKSWLQRDEVSQQLEGGWSRPVPSWVSDDKVCMFSHSVVSDSLWPHGWLPTRPLCPWDFSGKNARVSCHFLLQGESSRPKDWTHVSWVSCFGRWILCHCTTWEARLMTSAAQITGQQSPCEPLCQEPSQAPPRLLTHRSYEVINHALSSLNLC